MRHIYETFLNFSMSTQQPSELVTVLKQNIEKVRKVGAVSRFLLLRFNSQPPPPYLKKNNVKLKISVGGVRIFPVSDAYFRLS